MSIWIFNPLPLQYSALWITSVQHTRNQSNLTFRVQVFMVPKLCILVLHIELSPMFITLKKEMIVYSVFPISLHFLLNGMNAVYFAFQLIWKQSLSICVKQSFTITPEVKEENSNHDLDVIKVYMDDVEFVLVTFLNTSIL